MPRVSIGLPVYNGERYLREALGSLLGQTFGDLEVIVSDNGSSDASAEIAREVAARDPRVRVVVHAENRGAAWNYNHTVHQARGELFKWAAHDDVCEPTFVERCVEALDRRGDAAALAFPQMRFVDASGATLGDYDDPIHWDGRTPSERLWDLLREPGRSFLHRCFPVSGLIRLEALRKTRLIGAFNSSDKAVLVELALLGDFEAVPERLFLRRIHEGNSVRPERSAREIAAWFDPRLGSSFPMVRTRLLAAYTSAALWRIPLPLAERARCARVLARVALPQWRTYAGELRRRLVGA